MSQSKPEAPPSYAQATGSSTASSAANKSSTSRLEVPQAENGIPASVRRSMEDEQRSLPSGWVRQWDAKEKHQYFVDTTKTPTRSIWHHPYDDEEYLKSLTSEERERIQEEERNLKESHMGLTDNESPSKPTTSKVGGGSTAQSVPLPERPQPSNQKSTFGRKLKDKVTGKTHEERQAERARKEEEERRYYEAHMRFRDCMQRAQATGQPQFFARDKDGKDIYIEPPQAAYGAYGGYNQGTYGYNPYASGPYANPNARFVRPPAPYGRPYGAGYGGGMGMPIMGGLLGGMLLGGLLF